MTLWGETFIVGGDLPTLGDLVGFASRPRWMADGLCQEHPSVNFFPAKGESLEPAKAICRRCLVVDECLTYAASLPLNPDGVWGGTSGRERRVLREPRPAELHACAGGCGRMISARRTACGTTCRSRVIRTRSAA